MAKTAILNLRVEPELKEQLIKLAEDDKRSLNTKCEMMLESQIALEKQKRNGKNNYGKVSTGV